MSRAQVSESGPTDPRSLCRHEAKVYSQFGEDGILREIFARLPASSLIPYPYFVEFGASDGSECNGRYLVESGWAGLMIEGNRESYAGLVRRYGGNPRVRCLNQMVGSGNVETLFDEAGVPEEPDLLSIDIDGNDYWVWKAITRYRPRVVVIEYNASYPPPRLWVRAESDAPWNGTDWFGASLESLARLGQGKGYTLVGCSQMGVNAFFVRTDLARPTHFICSPPEGVASHYMPPRYGPNQGGHPSGSGPWHEI